VRARSLGSGLLALALVPGCGGDSPPASPATGGGAAPAFELRDVVAAALAALPAPAEPEPLDEDALAELGGLCSLAGSETAMVAVAREDVARFPAASAARALAGIARDAELSDRDRTGAVDLIPVEHERGSDELARLAGSANEGTPAWLRARAAWRLAQGGSDHVVPALLVPLKYEKDHETVVWLGAALARRANFAGLDGLIAIERIADSPARANAAYELGAILQAVGVASVDALWRAWRTGDPDGVLPHPERSARYRREIWAWVARMNEFQLRGVDDARFLLERMDRDAARILGEALHERDLYVRVHGAQSLARMGPRGAAACAELRAALGEREVAPHAALALGHVGCRDAYADLAARLAPETAVELRLACTRALGFLGEAAAAGALRGLFDAEPAELAQAATESVALLDGEARDAAGRLLDWIEDPRVEPASSERALRAWLYERGADDLLKRWDALATPADFAETPEEARARRGARVTLVRAYLAP
jgi:hypothetical protein